jgi:hypothetical protein
MAKKKQQIEVIEEEKSNKVADPKTKKTILTLFLFLLPLLVIGLTNELLTKWLLFFYIGVLLKNFIDDFNASRSD